MKNKQKGATLIVVLVFLVAITIIGTEIGRAHV